MKAKIFNTIVGIIGIGSMVNYAFEAGMNASLGALFGIGLWTFVVSLVGTIGIVSYESAMQERREREYVEMLKKAYSYKR